MYPLDEEDEDNLNNKPIKRKKMYQPDEVNEEEYNKNNSFNKKKKRFVKVICSSYLRFILYNI